MGSEPRKVSFHKRVESTTRRRVTGGGGGRRSAGRDGYSHEMEENEEQPGRSGAHVDGDSDGRGGGVVIGLRDHLACTYATGGDSRSRWRRGDDEARQRGRRGRHSR